MQAERSSFIDEQDEIKYENDRVQELDFKVTPDLIDSDALVQETYIDPKAIAGEFKIEFQEIKMRNPAIGEAKTIEDESP
jgi:hypothetical protein